MKKADLIKNEIIENGFIELDGGVYYIVCRINDKNFGDIGPKLRKQLTAEGIMDNGYIGFIDYKKDGKHSIGMLPIYGSSERYCTRWFETSIAAVVDVSLKDRQLGLSKRAKL